MLGSFFNFYSCFQSFTAHIETSKIFFFLFLLDVYISHFVGYCRLVMWGPQHTHQSKGTEEVLINDFLRRGILNSVLTSQILRLLKNISVRLLHSFLYYFVNNLFYARRIAGINRCIKMSSSVYFELTDSVDCRSSGTVDVSIFPGPFVGLTPSVKLSYLWFPQSICLSLLSIDTLHSVIHTNTLTGPQQKGEKLM